MSLKGYKNRGREEEIRALLHQRILVVDGAMGTMIQGKNPTAADFGGASLEGCNENLNLTRPDIIRSIHEVYLGAGADIIETNTFGAASVVLAEYALQSKSFDINLAAAQIARQAADKFSTAGKPRFVAGSMGPTTKTILVTGGVTFAQLEDAYAEQALGLMEGGADILLLETAQDTLNLKAGLNGIERAFAKLNRSVPVMISATIEVMGTMLGGQGAEALYISLEHKNLLSIGLNCATGPDFMTDHIRTLSELARFNISCIPNAGLPDENGLYNETPEMLVKKLERFIGEGWVNIIGGCCGTTPDHIHRMAEMAQGKTPRQPVQKNRCHVAGLEPFEATDEKRPILIGERTNVIGSRVFKDLIVNEKWEEASEIGRKQARSGAHILDVCLANPDRDELRDMERFLDMLVKKVKLPLMIDTTDAEVLEAALRKTPGKCVINSINLEDGEERFEKVIPLVHLYGASVIVGTIDEDKAQGMAVTSERKLEIALRSFKLLTEKYGIKPEDIIFDPLVFPCATGDKNYYGSAAETIEGIRKIKQALPRCKTILGVSNVSFGLPGAGREVLNAVFLHHNVKAGLDMAIVNSEKLARYASIPKEEIELAERVMFWKGPGVPGQFPGHEDPIAEFTAHFRERKVEQKKDARKDLPIEERVAANVVEGSKDGLLEDLDTLLKTLKPLEIINGPLMKGMDEVGRLFAANELIVAEVLQSAEVMKAAVAHLEPHMDQLDSSSKGKVLLATVKGDVHDIGKNLVHIILKNNGYQIVDLGIKVAPEQLVEAIRKEKPTMVGLSGLLVKSAQQMVITAEDLRNSGANVPILVGGAALSPKFTALKIATQYGGVVVYCKDAMSGLDAANRLVDSDKREAFLSKNKEIQEYLRAQVTSATSLPEVAPQEAAVITHEGAAPTPPDLKLHIEQDFDVETIFKYINPIMLFGKHLGLKGSPISLIEQGNPKALELQKRIEDLKGEVLAKGLMRARAVYRFFAAYSEGETIYLMDRPDGKILQTFTFPRQSASERLCLSDFVRPKTLQPDYAAIFVVTCGDGIREESERLRDAGEYLKSHALQALAIESAEGFAELLHERLRSMWGIPDPKEMTIRQKFQAQYRGLRVSFGYPSCPNLEDQAKLFDLLDPKGHIGVNLTEGFMMEPEASVSALVFHHPNARYFSVASNPSA